MRGIKKPIGIDVLTAAKARIAETFNLFPRVYLSLSGGKDSAAMMHLVAKEARKQNRKFGVLIVDLEAQYKMTINHIIELLELYEDVVDPYWVCLPISLRNAVSVYEPKWICWDKTQKESWVRDLPKIGITDECFFPFFQHGMEFEDFIPRFGEWYSDGKPTACFVGIRTDESLNRFRAITNRKKKTLNGRCWTTKMFNTLVYNVYPIYDWRTKDIWTYFGKYEKPYNKVYDLFNQAGVPISKQRLCQPFGDDQREGLWLYHIIEPDTWAKLIARVAGVNSGAEFVQYPGNSSGRVRVTKPDNHTWQSFSQVILDSLPDEMAEHYRNKIFIFLRWYEDRGYKNGIPDEADPKDESARRAPSWRRICRMLLRNDYWAKGLSFTQTKHGYFYQRYLDRIKREREKIKRRDLI